MDNVDSQSPHAVAPLTVRSYAKKAPFSDSPAPTTTSRTLGRMRAQLVQRATGTCVEPVGGIASLSIPDWSRKEPVEEKAKNRFFSREMRAVFQVMDGIRREHPDLRLAWVTVNFSDKAAKRVGAGKTTLKKQPAKAYADAIAKRAKRLSAERDEEPVVYILMTVLEDASNSRHKKRLMSEGFDPKQQFPGLHAHSLVLYFAEDEEVIKRVFKADRNDTRNAVRWAMTNRAGYPVDVGAADYMSKDLFSPSKHLIRGRGRLYYPRDLNQEARQLYAKKAAEFMAPLKRLEDDQAMLLDLRPAHAMRYVRTGKLPSDDRTYDWEYEES